MKRCKDVFKIHAEADERVGKDIKSWVTTQQQMKEGRKKK
jgi:hypothetical protein